MRIRWWFVVEWSFILCGMVVFVAIVAVLTGVDRETLYQAAHDFGYNLADLLLGGVWLLGLT